MSHLNIMLMRKVLLLIVLVLGCLPMQADEYDYLWLHSPDDSSTQSFAVDDLWKITFGSEAMSVWLDGQSSPVWWPYASLWKMTFESEPTTGVEDVAEAESSIVIRCTPGEVRVESASPLKSVSLYSVQGIRIVRFGQGETAVSYPLPSLPQGIYIVRAETDRETRTAKFVKR